MISRHIFVQDAFTCILLTALKNYFIICQEAGAIAPAYVKKGYKINENIITGCIYPFLGMGDWHRLDVTIAWMYNG